MSQKADSIFKAYIFPIDNDSFSTVFTLSFASLNVKPLCEKFRPYTYTGTHRVFPYVLYIFQFLICNNLYSRFNFKLNKRVELMQHWRNNFTYFKNHIKFQSLKAFLFSNWIQSVFLKSQCNLSNLTFLMILGYVRC